MLVGGISLNTDNNKISHSSIHLKLDERDAPYALSKAAEAVSSSGGRPEFF